MAKYQDLMQATVDKIVKAIESGEATGEGWERPWQLMFASTRQHNAESGRAYNGINQFSLGFTNMLAGRDDPRWCTNPGWERLGAQVREDERRAYQEVLFWKISWYCDDHGDGKGQKSRCCKEAATRPWAMVYRVWHVSQVDNAPEVETPEPLITPDERIPMVDLFLEGTGAVIADGGDRAYFRPSLPDRIHLPRFEAFTSIVGYYATAMHELTHWSGHDSRLDRTKGKSFGDHDYAKEELVAELGSSWLLQALGIEPAPSKDASEYLANWLAALKAEPTLLYHAAKEAQTAVDYLVSLVLGAEEAA